MWSFLNLACRLAVMSSSILPSSSFASSPSAAMSGSPTCREEACAGARQRPAGPGSPDELCCSAVVDDEEGRERPEQRPSRKKTRT